MVRALLERGADVGATDKNGWAAHLFSALAQKQGIEGSDEVAALLAEAGAATVGDGNPNFPSWFGK